MTKPILGLVLGGILGVFDGLSALLSAGHDPVVRDGIVGIVIGSTFKGLIGGIVTGWIARKYNSLAIGITAGLGIALLLAFLVASMEGKYYVEIMLPGGIMGLIVGFATQRYGVRPASAR